MKINEFKYQIPFNIVILINIIKIIAFIFSNYYKLFFVI